MGGKSRGLIAITTAVGMLAAGVLPGAAEASVPAGAKPLCVPHVRVAKPCRRAAPVRVGVSVVELIFGRGR